MRHGEQVVGDEMVILNNHFHASASNVSEHAGQAGPTPAAQEGHPCPPCRARHCWYLLAAHLCLADWPLFLGCASLSRWNAGSVICLCLLLARSACASAATWLHIDAPLRSCCLKSGLCEGSRDFDLASSRFQQHQAGPPTSQLLAFL
jgi:hypothetical protein